MANRPRIFFKIPPLSNLRFLSPLRVPAPLREIPFLFPIRVDLPSFAGPKTHKTLPPAIERLPPTGSSGIGQNHGQQNHFKGSPFKERGRPAHKAPTRWAGRRHSPVAEAGTAFDGFQASHAKPPSNFFQNSATFRHPLSPFLPFAAIFRHSRAPSDFRVLLCARDIFMRCLLTALRSGCHPGLTPLTRSLPLSSPFGPTFG